MSGTRPLLELVRTDAAVEQADGPKSAFLLELEQAPPKEREERLSGHIQDQVARVLKLDASRRPDRQQGFFDMGMDSLMILDFKTRLQNSLGYPLPSTLPFEYPTIEALTAYLLGRLFEPSAPEETSAPSPEADQPDDLAHIKALTESELKALIDAELEMLIDE
jgi:phthiocerol/phenolphthiocerol synthesis type-I polyketide synthase D